MITTTPEDFIAELRRAAYDCADMYSIDDCVPADAPPEVAEGVWDDFLLTVKACVAGMFQRMGADEETVALAQEAALSMMFDRFAQLDVMPEGGRA